MSRDADWSPAESAAVVRAYADMLDAELRGDRVVKAAFNRRVQQETGRNRGSVEFKFRNVSAAFTDLGYAYVEGYRPAFNYQHMLFELAANAIGNDTRLRDVMARAVDAPVLAACDAVLTEVKAPARERELPASALRDRRPIVRVTNWLQVEAANRTRGRQGETLVLEWEDRRLRTAGARHLAEKIEHVSATQGDGLGFDIHSFDVTGADRLIEVKTTRFGEYTPFFASVNEVAVSADRAPQWHLYRVFDVQRQPRFFSRRGALAERFDLDPILFKARVA